MKKLICMFSLFLICSALAERGLENLQLLWELKPK